MDEGSNVRRLRASRRFKLFLPTRMRLGHHGFAAHLIDLSVSGALATATQPPAVGTRVFVRMLGGSRAARVVRRDGREFGIEFAAPLTVEEVAVLVEAREEAAA